MAKKFVNLKNARAGEYKRVIEKIVKTGKCPFCPENFKYHKKPVFKAKGNWFLTDNTWPYKNASCHLMIIGKTHKENFRELQESDWQAISFLTNFAIKKFRIKGGAICMRFGDTDFTGASVAHLHFHVISPGINKKTGKARTVSFPVG